MATSARNTTGWAERHMAGLNLAHRIGLGVVAKGWSQVTALVLAVLAARVLGRQDFGIYAIASVFVILLQGLMYGGIYDYIIKTQSDDLDADTCFWMSLGFAAAGGLLIAALAPIMGLAIHAKLITALMLALAPSTMIAAVASWQEALLLRAGRLPLYYTLGIAMESLAVTAAIAALFGGMGVWSYVIYRYAQLVLAAGSYFVVMRRAPRLQWNTGYARSVFQFASNIYLSRIVGTISNYSADLLIGVMVNPAAAGAYRLGSRIVTGVSDLAYQPVNTMAWVHFAKAGRNPGPLGREWLGFITILSLTAWPCLAGLAVVGKTLVHAVVGPGWDDAVPVIIILAGARMLMVFDLFLDAMLGVYERTGVILKLRSGASVGSVLMLSVLAYYGATGAAVSQLLIGGCVAACGLALCLQITKVPPKVLIRSTWPGVVATVVAASAAMLVGLVRLPSVEPIGRMFITAGAGAAAWSIVLLYMFKRRHFAATFAV